MKPPATQSPPARIVLTGALLFCAFGLLATLEPNPPAKQWLWRAIYGSGALLYTIGLLKGPRR
jgi:VIT1/CCC1 family predicted Fe2+/Mn2+ transporter